MVISARGKKHGKGALAGRGEGRGVLFIHIFIEGGQNGPY